MLTVKRTFPPNIDVNPTFADRDWTDFCSQVDSILESLVALKKKMAKEFCIVIFLTMIFIPVIVFAVVNSLDNKTSILFILTMLGMVFAPFIVLCCLISKSKAKILQITDELRAFCSATSDGTPGINFIFRERHLQRSSDSVRIVRYIDVVVHSRNDDGGMHRPSTPDTFISFENTDEEEQ